MSDVSGLIAAIAALIGAIVALVPVLAPLLKRRHPSGGDGGAKRGLLARMAVLFVDERDKVSRRTTAAQLCALVACAFVLVLFSLRSGRAAGDHTTDLLLLVVVGAFALVGGASGVNKMLVAWPDRGQRPLVYTALLGVVFSLAAWVSALIMTAPLWWP